ncbi:MAG: Trp family transcriptional regulator [Candidatus Wolfebacteria bacterium]|nr:Trp family transcriptional regulator [Candidatus Wolfebacteria bacterium]
MGNYEPEKFKSREEWEDFVWERFISDLRKSQKEKLVEFFNHLVTVDEKRMFAKRFIAIVLIKEGKSYKDIGKVLWISPSTVRALKKVFLENSDYQSNYEYYKNKKSTARKNLKTKERDVFDYWLNFPFPKKSGKGRWKFLYYQGF